MVSDTTHIFTSNDMDVFVVVFLKRGSYMVWEINIEVCPRLEFYTIVFINCLGCDFFLFMAHLSFLCNSIANL